MKILAIGKRFTYDGLDIVHASDEHHNVNISDYDYILISGGDGMIRRTVKELYNSVNMATVPPLIINPIGSFNVVSKIHKPKKALEILKMIVVGSTPKIKSVPFYSVDKKIFLFSCGNSGDVAHIFISEVLRFGMLKTGSLRYLVSILFLLPFHLLATPFLLFSKSRFFVFTPLQFKRFCNIYGSIDGEIEIELNNGYNVLEFDGDLSVVKKSKILIKHAGDFALVTG